jgi:formamidopyrimidine-DNA glycosylase
LNPPWWDGGSCVAFPPRFRERLEGVGVDALSRRAKYILAHCSSGETLILHLGMTGRFTVARGGRVSNLGEFYFEAGSDGAADGAHDHVVFDLDDGTRIIYSDPRRFGLMDLAEAGALHQHRAPRQ